MPNPKYENVTQMENAAANEFDATINLRLVAGGGASWLRVVYTGDDFGPAYTYYHDLGRGHTQIARSSAQNLIDREWGKLS